MGSFVRDVKFATLTSVESGQLITERPRACDRCRRRRTRCEGRSPCIECYRVRVKCTYLLAKRRPGRQARTRQQVQSKNSLQESHSSAPDNSVQMSDSPQQSHSPLQDTSLGKCHSPVDTCCRRLEEPQAELMRPLDGKVGLTLGRGLGFGGDYGLHLPESARTNSASPHLEKDVRLALSRRPPVSANEEHSMKVDRSHSQLGEDQIPSLGISDRASSSRAADHGALHRYEIYERPQADPSERGG
jgi:hypothetical protein